MYNAITNVAVAGITGRVAIKAMGGSRRKRKSRKRRR
jgi:hypothetical protein